MTEGSTEQTPLESLKTRPTTHIIDEISDTPKSTTTENTILIYIPLISLSLPIKSLPAAVSLIFKVWRLGHGKKWVVALLRKAKELAFL